MDLHCDVRSSRLARLFRPQPKVMEDAGAAKDAKEQYQQYDTTFCVVLFCGPRGILNVLLGTGVGKVVKMLHLAAQMGYTDVIKPLSKWF